MTPARPSTSSTRGATLIVLLVFFVVFGGVSAWAMRASVRDARVSGELVERFQAEAAAVSRVNLAIAKVRRGGILTMTMNGPFGHAHDAVLDVVTQGRLVTIRARAMSGRGSSEATVHARAILRSGIFVPSGPLVMGNGAIEWPRGNDAGHAVASYISNALDLQVSAWNHPYDYLTHPIPTPPPGDPRWYDPDPESPTFGAPFSVISTQNGLGQANALDWLAPWTSGGSTYDPAQSVERVDDDPGYAPVPVESSAPEVQTFAYDLYATRAERSDDVFLTAGEVESGQYGNAGEDLDGDGVDDGEGHGGLGTLDDPRVVFVTGALKNLSAFRGAGILVIRDDFDPEAGGQRQVSTRARMDLRAEFEWTGLVVLAGWAPRIDSSSLPATSHAVINGSLLGEDSVKSGGETSLEGATIELFVGSGLDDSSPRGELALRYSREVFMETLPSGAANPIHALLPVVEKRLAALSTSGQSVPAWDLPAGMVSVG